MTRSLTLALVAFLSLTSGWAQMSHLYTTIDGLPSSHIDHMAFDQEDFLWVSTDLGLARFNGERFITYQAMPGSQYALQENQVNVTYTANEDCQWIGACDGLYSFSSTTNSFTHYQISDRRSDISVSVIVNHPLKAGTLILGTMGWGIREFDVESGTFSEESAFQYQQLLPASPDRILVDRHARMWCSYDKGLTVIDLKTKTCRVLNEDYSWLASEEYKVKCLVEDRTHNRLFIGTERAGVIEVDLTSLVLKRTPIGAQRITAMALSPDNRLMVGSECQGLWRYDCETNVAQRIAPSGPVNLDVAKVHSIAYDSQMNLWLGIYQKGVYMIPNLTGFFTHQTINSNPHDDRNLASVTGFASLPKGGRAYALDGAGVIAHYADGTTSHYTASNSIMQTDAVLALTTLPDGTMLAGTYQYGVYAITTDRKVTRLRDLTDIEHVSVKDFELDTLGHTAYIATSGHGLFAYDYAQHTLQAVTSPEDAMKWINDLYLCSHRQLWISKADHVRFLDLNTGLFHTPHQPITRVSVCGYAETSDGELWMAANYGLLHYNAGDSTLEHIIDPSDTQRHSYAAIMNSEDGRIWLASASRVTQYDTLTHRFTHYLDPTIATVGTINEHSSKRWPDRSFSFGGDNGVINYRPQDVDTYRRPTRPLLLTQLWVDNAPTDYDPALGDDNVLNQALWCATELRLPVSRASFSISFTLQDYNSEIGISYSYRMRGLEEEWRTNPTGEKTANYQRLPAGHYVLEIRATQDNDQEGVGTVVRELSVIIEPSWYNSWWFHLFWILTLLALIWVIINQVNERRRIHRDLRQAEMQRQVKEGRLNMLTEVSHEIRTPLTLIISPLRKMMSRKTDPATQTTLETMYRNALRIMTLVNQQMDVRKLERSEMKLHVKELSLHDYLQELMQYFGQLATSRNITYTLTLPVDRENMTLWADASQLDKVILNLLSNAMKFTPERGNVSLTVSQPSAQLVRITVYNSGSQLPKAKQAQAFEGIGLSLARDITNLHHGNLSVRNLEDGVAFDVDLPASSSVYTAEELAVHDIGDELVGTQDTNAEGQTDERQNLVISSTTVHERDKEKELIEQLNDELREKQRLRERRSALSIGINAVQMSSADEKLMERVMDIIKQNLSDSEFSVESLSEQIGISRVHLNRKLKELLDVSPSVLIKSVRLKQAALALVQNKATVAEVAYSVGFSSPAYFTTNFTQYYGKTPKDFINAYNENPDSPEMKQLLEG